MSGAEIAQSLVPPRQFDGATLDSYRPDADYPSQSEAVERVRAFVDGWGSRPGKLFSRRRRGAETRPGIYLDGGFGVGKTHLLAALWSLAPGRKYFGTFIEYTALVGALGYQKTITTLSGASLIAIDEFELDDPGDTMMMSRLLGELAASGTRIAATSNTPPNALGEGRFAAADFLREISALADRFEIVRIDGLDYRRREVEGSAVALDDAGVDAALHAVEGEVTSDGFDELLHHLAAIHPSRYVKMVDGLRGIGIRGVRTLTDQSDALRFVAFVDRLYDAQVRIFSTGVPLDQVFGDDMLSGGYRKKYLRAISRLVALTSGRD
ncbi:cell division protein ZapE [Schumannella sp. 10F1B-5-1]|uniref:cell division protein ZapE n=1 Tax=Schumannella sp. 10F1B-5-1 TaxID=2590780 RepID=UPI001130C1F0|nr:cell division protein ZapE [Schumannella sp. 10F1B-5-1]TPW71106.1 cell division protein ZapE [Schumannella sp. 10F1B-5-1]